MWETLITTGSSKKCFDPEVRKQAEYYQVNRLGGVRRLCHMGGTLEKANGSLKGWHKVPRISDPSHYSSFQHWNSLMPWREPS